MNQNPESSQQTEIKGQAPERRTRRQYSDAFKAELLHACTQPGATPSAVAHSHGIRPNQLRRWLQKAKTQASQPTKKTIPQNTPTQTSFLAVAVKAPPVSTADIRMNLQSGATRLQIEWPISASSQCAQWLREVLA